MADGLGRMASKKSITPPPKIGRDDKQELIEAISNMPWSNPAVETDQNATDKLLRFFLQKYFFKFETDSLPLLRDDLIV